MLDFYQRAIKKLDKLNPEQCTELLMSSVEKVTLLRAVADSIDVGILVCDKDNNLILVNKNAQRFLPLDYSEGEQIWSSIKDVKLTEFLKDIFENHERVMGREIDIVYRDKYRLFSVNVVPLVYDHKINGTLVYIEDITEKRKGEERLRRIENLASLTTLAAGVAHEIKNPLGSISIHLQLLQKALSKNKKSDSKTDKYFNVLKEEVDRLNKIVVNFLFAVRPLTLELRETDIKKLITRTMEFVKFEMEQSNIKCLLEFGDNIPLLLIDERLIKQVLLNLVKNAKTAMPEGGVLSIAANFEENEVKISVRDTGVGITKENISKIFEPYFTTSESGTGLGLTISYKIIREHHGEITVDSEPDTGTEIKIILPVPQKETRLLAYKEN